MRWRALLLFVVTGPALLPAQAATPQSATLRAALRAYDSLDITRAIALGHRALGERLSGPDQARAYEMLGFKNAADKETSFFHHALLWADSSLR